MFTRLLFMTVLALFGGMAPALADNDVEPWQVAVRPTFAGCDDRGRNVYRVAYANDMYDNPKPVGVHVVVKRDGVIMREHVVNLAPNANKDRYYRVGVNRFKSFVSRVNGKVATSFKMEGLPCK